MKHVLHIVPLLLLANLSLAQVAFHLEEREADEEYTETSLLQKLIQFPGISGKEKESALFLKHFCEKKGLFTRVFSSGDSAYNFSASLYPLEMQKPNIILMSHLDVVPPGDLSSWRKAPFEGNMEGDTIFGRGAIDCKGLAVMQLFGLFAYIEEAKTRDLPVNITFLAVSGEETGNPGGANYVVSNFLKDLNALVVFGEGGSGLTHLVPSKPELEVFGISLAEKSSLWLKLEVNKKTHGHGAVPPDLYANKRLIKSLINLMDQKREVKFSKISRQMFKDLGKMEGGMKGFVIRHINWIIFWPFVKKYFREGEIFNVLVKSTFVITDMGTVNSEAVNQIGSGAYAILDCRLLPGDDKKRFIRRVQFAVGNKVDVSIISESPNTLASPVNDYFKLMQDALKKTYPKSISSPILFPASTDNNFFRQYQIPTYGVIPVVFTRENLDGIHGENEYLRIRDLKLGVDTYRNFIKLVLEKHHF